MNWIGWAENVPIYYTFYWFLSYCKGGGESQFTSAINDTGDQIRIRIKVKIQELLKLKMESSRAVDSYNGGIEVQNGAVGGSQILLTLLRNRIRIRIRIKWKMSDPDPHQSEKRVPDPDLQCCWKVNYLMCWRGSIIRNVLCKPVLWIVCLLKRGWRRGRPL